MFKIFTRTNNTAKWDLYGEFSSEAEWKREQAYIRALRSMGPLYLKRVAA